MLYLQTHVSGRQVALLFSTTDSVQEIQKFLRLIHAPFRALHMAASTTDRTHAELYGKPRELAATMLPPTCVFSGPMERVLWEQAQPAVHSRHPHPWGLPDNPSYEDK